MSRSYEALIDLDEEYAADVKERADRLAEYQSSLVERVQSEAEAIRERQTELAETLSTDFADSWQNFINGTQSAGDAFKDFAQSTLQWIQKMILKQLVFTAIQKGMSFFGGLTSPTDNYFGSFGSARAAGGPVYPHSTYLVGEKGPELLQMGSAAGNIVPNNQLSQAASSGGDMYNVTINAVDTRSFSEYIRRNPAPIIEAVNRNVRGNGMLRGAIRGTM